MNLKEIRTEKGLTQEELAARADVSRPFISQMESGNYSPSLKTAQALAKALGCTVDDLIREPEAEDADDRN